MEVINLPDQDESRPLPQLLSLVIPLFNEEEMIPHLRHRLASFLPTLPCPVELILVNDGSRDGTLLALQRWAYDEPHLIVISLSRNFGHQAASTAGLDRARGDAVVLMDADLQDPPELIHRMIAEYQKGFDVVYAQREARVGENWFKRLSAWIFYRLMRLAARGDLPADTGDFRLVAASTLRALQSMRETHRFIRGMVTWVGYRQVAVRFVRPARVAGETKYPLSQMMRFAWTAAISFSPLPLRLVFGMGLLVACAAIVIGAYALGSLLLHYYVVPGWTSIMFTLCLIGSFILIGLGMVGEYIAKIYEEVKQRPLYIVDERRSRRLTEVASGDPV
ncbi:MAG: glycosyltransferase family 2 protein [Bryobacteraceae bacterium]